VSDLSDRAYAAADRLARHYQLQHGETWDITEIAADLGELVNRCLLAPETIEVVLRELRGWEMRR
jgi:hypothetical protein